MPTLAMTKKELKFEDLAGLRAEGYIRDSTLDQRDGFGPELQRRAVENFATAHGLIMGSAWYTDFITGTSTLKRSGFRQALEDGQADVFDVLLVYHTSRFARNRADAIRYKAVLRKLGKVVVFVSQNIISGNDNDFLNEGISEVLDEHYSRNLSRWTSDGLRVKASEGYALGNAPLGFRHTSRSGRRGAWTVPDEETLPVLLALLRGYAEGRRSFRTLAQDLNAKGFRTNMGKPFTESSISTTLNNPFYTGKVRYHRNHSDEEVRDGVHKVPEEVKALWVKCQDVRMNRQLAGQPSPRSRNHQVYPLTGVLVCDNCDQPFHGVATRNAGKIVRRMFHSERRCSMRPLSTGAPNVEQEFAERVLSFINLDERWEKAVMLALIQERPQPDRGLDLKRVEMALSNLRKQHLWGAIGDEEFREQFRALESQRRGLATLPAPIRLPNLKRAAQLLRDLPSLWKHPGISQEQRQEVTREVFQEVRLKSGRITAVRPAPQYAPLFAYSMRRASDVGGARPSY